MQLLGLALSFAVILALVGRRVPLGLCLLVGSAVLALTSLMPPGQVGSSVYAALVDRGTIELVLDVAAITSLAGVLKSSGLLETMVRSVTRLLGGARLAIMAVPSIIGTLPVLGGAILSAPMVDGLGDGLRLTKERKAAVNLVFRHAWFFIAPFSPSLVLAGQLAQVDLGRLILRQAPFALVMLVAGYAVLLARVRAQATGASHPAEASPAADAVDLPLETAEALGPRGASWTFLRSSSPLILGVVLSLGIGRLRLPLYASVAIGLAWALVLARRHPAFRYGGLPAAWSSVQWSTVLTMASVMVFARVMKDAGATGALVRALVGSGLPPWVLMVALPAAVGFVAGAPSVPIGVAFPALMPLAPPGAGPAVAAILYSSGFMAYFISPLHLCQVLSSQFFRVPVPRLYREYWPVVVLLGVCLALYVALAFG